MLQVPDINMAAAIWTTGEGAGQINVNIECSSLKCEPNVVHNNIVTYSGVLFTMELYCTQNSIHNC
jgi:hypothetical protein